MKSLLGYLTLIEVVLSQPASAKEYCQDDTFKAQCQHNQVILIEYARYGRPFIGRCVQSNLGFLGCVKDVTRFLSNKCSGKQRCQLEIMHKDLRDFEPCSRDVSWHLDASYKCLNVESGDASSCRGGMDVKQTTGYLSSHIAEANHVGHSICPWSIKYEEGLKIQLTALNFLSKTVSPSRSNRPVGGSAVLADICYQFARVLDGKQHHTLTLCSDNLNETVVYTSTSSEIQIYFTPRAEPTVNAAYVLRYSPTGCGNPPFVEDATTIYSEPRKMLTIRCNYSGETWFLTCNATKWIGKVGVCPSAAELTEVQGWSLFHSEGDFPYGLVLVVAIGVALGIFLGGTALVIVSYRMKRKYPRYELPPELPVQDYYRESSGTVKSIRQNEVSTYGGLQPHDIVYDSALGMNVDSNLENKDNRNSNSRIDRKHGHLYESPQMM